MVEKSPLVIVDGAYSQLPPGDSIRGTQAGTVTALSGVQGGGDLSQDSATLQARVYTDARASGVIVSANGLGLDGVAQVAAESALASGNAGLVLSSDALASGSAAQVLATDALASGNAALNDVINFNSGNSITLEAASTILVGNPVGLDDTNRVQVVVSGAPTVGSLHNFIGVAQSTVSSGSNVNVLISKSVDLTQSNLSVGSFYYVDPTTSGFTTTPTYPPMWSGALPWQPVAKAVSTSGMILLRTM